MTLLPKVKLKAQVNFPAHVLDGTGIDVVKSNGAYRFDLDYGDFAPPVGSVTDAAHQNALLWNSVTGSYTLAPMALLAGGSLPDAPNDGTQYARQSLGWTPIVIPASLTPSATLPVMDGTAIPGVATAYSRGDHVHPTDTSRASSVFTQIGTGAVNRTMLSKAQDIINAADFGLLPANTAAQNVTAWGVLMTAAAASPCTIRINRGAYDFNAPIGFNPSNVRLTGDGIDVTILRCTFAAGDFITSSGTIYYQTIDNLTITSSVTRTSGAMFKPLGLWKRGLIYRVKVSQHFHGIYLPQFEVCTIAETNIVTPTGNGIGIIAGTGAVTNQGAGLNIFDCLIRGNDETNPASAAVGLAGMQIVDIEAVFCVNSDFSVFTSHCVTMIPTTRVANCYFLQTFFDATVAGHNVFISGAGVKISLQFTGSWFSSAGGFGAGAINCYGLYMDANGGYDDIIVSGCRFLTPSAAGVYITNPYMAVNVTGCNFINCGANAGSTHRHSIAIDPGSAALRTMNITGNYFTGAGGVDVLVNNANAAGRVNFSGNALTRGMVFPDGALFGNVSGNTDTSVSPLTFQLASASTLNVSPLYNYIIITGTTTINRIRPTYPGHQLSLRFLAALTVADDASNLRLVGNLVTTATTVLTIVCEGNGDWREISRVVT